MNARAVWILVALAPACAETGQDRVSVPLFLAGTDVSDGIIAAGDVSVVIDRADLAFGPLYLCAGNQAGSLCDTARLEWLDSTVVDTMDPTPARAGALRGVTGPVRSWMYDLGISSALTSDEPVVLEAAEALGGYSFVVTGRAALTGTELPFELAVRVQQSEGTEVGVPVVRKRATDAFAHDVEADETGVLMRFDPRPWLEDIDFRPYLEAPCAPPLGDGCDAGGTACVADGGARDAGDDCDPAPTMCLPDGGCPERIVIAAESQAYRSVRSALLAGQGPAFQWEFTP